MIRKTKKDKVFTVEEANSLLPQIRGLLEGIQREARFQRKLRAEVRRAASKAKFGGGTPHGATYVESVFRMKKQVMEIQALGVQVKDLFKGLCDFPHSRDGRLVYLCWQMGHETIRYWHESKAGFMGRQPL
jgi:hypothetical protein